MRRYRALLVGNWHYPDDPANLPDLKGPMNDVSQLAEALVDPQLGLFAPADVTTLAERSSHEITATMERFFGEATRDDTLLVYYSGHGITADNGSLLLCGRNARTDLRIATTVSSETVDQMIRACPAAAVVIVLDCCHAGAFKSGDLASELSGKGRYVLTASRSRDRAPDAEHTTGLSRFTGHLVRGLRGEAALPGADHITLSDLYRYVYQRMTSDGPIIPQRRFDGDGEIALGRAVAVVSSAPSLSLSETALNLGPVVAGEPLPVERIQVRSTTPDGSPAPWSVETEATWIILERHPSYLDIRITPRVGATRANLHLRNEVTGEIRTVRIAAQPLPAQPSAPVPVPVPVATAHLSGWRHDRSPAITAPDGVTPRELSPDPVADIVMPPARVSVDRGIQFIRMQSMVPQSPLDTTAGTRAEQKAMTVAGIPPGEQPFAKCESGDSLVLFTPRALYWTSQASSLAVAYNQFPGRTFRAAVGHVDFGDGVLRLIGPKAPDLVRVLTGLRETLLGA